MGGDCNLHRPYLLLVSICRSTVTGFSFHKIDTFILGYLQCHFSFTHDFLFDLDDRGLVHIYIAQHTLTYTGSLCNGSIYCFVLSKVYANRELSCIGITLLAGNLCCFYQAMRIFIASYWLINICCKLLLIYL